MGGGMATTPSHGASARRLLCVVRHPLGGIRTYLLYNYPILKRAGYKFTVVGPADPAFTELEREFCNSIGGRFVPIPVTGGKWRATRPIRTLLRREGFDVVHSQGLTAGALSSLANIGLGVPHVVTSHDVFPPGKFQSGRDRLRLLALGVLLRQASAIVSVTESAAANLQQHVPLLRAARGRLHTIPHGIELTKFAEGDGSERLAIRASLGISPDTRVFGFLGRFMEQKGFLPLLDAIDVLIQDPPRRTFHLLAVGSGDYEREYKAEVARRGLQKIVTFAPFCPEPASVLRGVDVLLMPSLWEAAGLLAMEAMILGVPVVGSQCVGLRDVLADTPSRLVPPGDRRAWAEALRAAIEAPWTEAAHSFAPEARTRFNIDRSAGQLIDLLGKVVCRP